MEPNFFAHVQVLSNKLFGKKWTDHIAAVYEGSAFGCARLELFTSEAKFRALEPRKVIVLNECISIRTAVDDKDREYLKLHMKNGSTISITSTELNHLRDTVSRAAFPSNFVTLRQAPSSSSDSSPNTPTDISETVPVLLLPNSTSRAKGFSDGNYELVFENLLLLNNGSVSVEAWMYSGVLWVATGEHCFGFEVENYGMLEFKCSQPSLIMDNFRRFIRFSSIFRPFGLKSNNTYNRNYTVMREESPLSHLAIEETEDEYHCAESSSSTSRTKDSGVSCSGETAEKPIEQATVYHPVSASCQSLNSSLREKKGFFKFLRRNSSKKKASADVKRGDFELNADDEWVRVKEPCAALDASKQQSNKFREELEEVISRTKTRKRDDHHLSATVLSEDIQSQFANLSPQCRTSIACSEPAHRYDL